MGTWDTRQSLTLSQTVTLNQEHYITIDIFVFPHKFWTAVLDNVIAYITIKIFHCINFQ